jgi:argininosuccinate lyase
MLDHIKVREDILSDSGYDAIFSVEEVNRLALDGMPFRDAYRKVGAEIENGNFKPDHNIHHTHEGSIGNLCNDRIADRMEKLVSSFPFGKIDEAVNKLVSK